MFDFKFTVFTPIYNRAHTIKRVYDSLCQQTFHDFEWLIIDDGSTDNTKELIENWQSQANFPIRYVWQKNRGKHVAINRAVQLAKGEFCLKADSDDAFISSALEKFNNYWESIPVDERDSFVGVTVLCMYENESIVGGLFPTSPFDSNSEEKFYRYKIKGEKWGCNRTDVYKLYPLPEINGVTNVPESYSWFRIAKKYKTRFINDPLRIYYQDAGDQLTKRSSLQKANQNIFYADLINISINWLYWAPYRFWKTAIQYVRFSLLLKEGFLKQLKRLYSIKAKLLWVLALVPGILLAVHDIVKLKNIKK